jgi:hypothetical protein
MNEIAPEVNDINEITPEVNASIEITPEVNASIEIAPVGNTERAKYILLSRHQNAGKTHDMKIATGP